MNTHIITFKNRSTLEIPEYVANSLATKEKGNFTYITTDRKGSLSFFIKVNEILFITKIN